jgi:hypothetical protein
VGTFERFGKNVWNEGNEKSNGNLHGYGGSYGKDDVEEFLDGIVEG